MKLSKLLFIAALVVTANVSAQLANFNLQVTKTDETCLGNGSLIFNVSNTSPGATVLYKVFKLPEQVNPLAVLTENTLGSLSAGTYKVEAIQALGALSNSKEQQITIVNAIVPFSFTVAAANQNCSDGGDIIVNTATGTAATYEIISGPVTRPLQTSNVFAGLPSGTYNIRAFDICGVGKVRTFTLSVINSILNISNPTYPDAVNTICDSITVNNIITPSAGNINYPITVQHTIDPLNIGGVPMTVNQVFYTGSPDALEVSAVLPRLMNQSYSYELLVTDNCNTVYEKTDNVVDPDLKVTLNTADAPCADKYLLINTTKFTNSYTIEFIEAPDGFDTASFNANGGGPFTDTDVTYGSEENPVPFGTYVVQVTDICGRTITESIIIEFVMPSPTVRGFNNGCFSEFGRIRISMADSELVSATITGAPSSYNVQLPQDVTGNINNTGILALNNMPLGIYTIVFTDDCGFEFEVEVEVPPFVEKDFNIAALPACAEGFGGVRVRSGNGDLTSIYITQAPTSFGQSLPYDVSSTINEDGDFYMSDLPEGTYTFTATDICGIVKEQEVNVEGYNPDLATFEFTPNCGSFSVKVTDGSNGTEGVAYWLQKLDETDNTWGHPGNNNVYTEGAVPTTATGIRLNNNSKRNNLNYTGKFRVVKKFETFTTGSSENTICLSILGEFTYTDVLAITSAYTLACIGEPNDVYLEVSGFPTSYRITRKDGEPFSINNGTDNVFTDLEPAEYRFRVEDACGNIVVRDFNVQSLPSIADALQPQDMILCTDAGTVQNHQFHLTDQNTEILGPLFSSMYTLTYHLSQEDADSGDNPLPEYYTNITNGQLIYARLVHNEIELCHGTTSFRLFIGGYQEPVIITSGTLCDDSEISLTVAGNYDTYLWSTGETTRTIFASEPGNYSVIVERAYGTAVCDGFAEFEIQYSEAPRIIEIDTEDWTNYQNVITVHTEGSGVYEYSIDGNNYQESNVFEGLENGVYQVYVRDTNGCGTDIKEVVLLNYPKFFTPNGDGTHERWHIKYSIKEPNLSVAIFDRYGKLITTFGSNHEGWDGTLNGIQLPSTDYWFVVTREDGREHRGHFAMLR